MTFLQNFSVVLLDMNGTFMFGHDRFGPHEDYFATYRALGGQRLDRTTLRAVMLPTLDALLRIYDSSDRLDDFPTLAEAFSKFGGAAEEDIAILESLFATHEIGDVPASHQAFLTALAQTHQLGVVSNICSHPSIWLPRFAGTGVFRLFVTLVFSSEGRSIKPSKALFQRALDHFPATSKVLFVGDSLERDILPAKSLGLSTVWIARAGSAHPAADRVIPTLPDLAFVPT